MRTHMNKEQDKDFTPLYLLKGGSFVETVL